MTLINKNTLVMLILPVVFAVLYGYVIPMTQTRESTNYIIALCQIMNLAMKPISLLSMKEEKEKDQAWLKEKIVIKENGLDDRIVEIMKHNIQTTLRSKASYQLVLRDGQGLEFVLLYPDNEVIKIFMFNKQDYLTLTKKYNRCLANDYMVDRLFASRTVLRLNKFNNLKLNCH